MSHTRTPLAIAIALAAVAATPAAAVIPHEGGQTPSAGAPTAGVERSAPPIARMDGLLPQPTAATTAGLTPPDRLDAVDAGRSLGAAVAVTPPDRVDTASAALVRPIVSADAGGFDWTDAGIGFAAAAGIALMGAGSLATVRWRRQTTRTLAH